MKIKRKIGTILSGLFFLFFIEFSRGERIENDFCFSVPRRYRSLFGIYGVGPVSLREEKWNEKKLNRTTKDAYRIHYRHFFLNNFVFFHHKNILSSVPIQEIISISNSIGGENIFSVPGEKLSVFIEHYDKGNGAQKRFIANKLKVLIGIISRYRDENVIAGWHLDKIHRNLPAGVKVFYKKIEKEICDSGKPKIRVFKLPPRYTNKFSPQVLRVNGDFSETDSIRECILPVMRDSCEFVSSKILKFYVFAAIAHGFNAICFDSGEMRIPLWSAFFHTDRKHYGFFDGNTVLESGLCSNFEYRCDLFSELSDLGEKLLPVLWLFRDAQYMKDIRIRRGGVWLIPEENAYILVSYKNSPLESHEQFMLPTFFYGKRAFHVLNLLTLECKEVRKKKVSFYFNSLPGAIFMITEKKGIVEKYKKDIEWARLYYRFLKLKIRADILRNTRLAETKKLFFTLRQVSNYAAEKNLSKAQSGLTRAMKLYSALVAESKKFKEINRLFVTANQILYDADMRLRKNVYNLSERISSRNNNILFGNPLFVREIREINTNINIIAARYYPLKLAFETGRQTDIKSFKLFVRDLRRVCARLYNCRLRKNLEIRPALVAINGDYNSAIWDFLRFNFGRAGLLNITPEGKVVYRSGTTAKLYDFDVLWLDWPVKSAAERNSEIGFSGFDILPDTLKEQGVLNLFEDFLATGGGILFTGSACLVLPRIRMENVRPKLLYFENVIRFGNGSENELLKSLAFIRPGIYIYKQMFAHPIFNHIEGVPLYLCGGNVFHSKCAFMWTNNNVPKNGTPLCWFTSAINPPADNMFFPIWEFKNRYGGKAMVFSFPGLNFSNFLFPYSDNIKCFINLKNLTVNMINYLGDKKQSYSVRVLPNKDIGILNLTDKKVNPKLKFIKNRGKNVFFPVIWKAEELPGSLIIDFGRTVEIRMIHIVTCSERDKFCSLGKFRFDIADSSGNFIAPNPEIAFISSSPCSAYAKGITFRFQPIKTANGFFLTVKPIVTSCLRISDLSPYYKSGDKKDLPVKISNIIVYGRIK